MKYKVDILVLPSAPLRENQEFETDAPPGHCSTTALFLSDRYLKKFPILLIAIFLVQFAPILPPLACSRGRDGIDSILLAKLAFLRFLMALSHTLLQDDLSGCLVSLRHLTRLRRVLRRRLRPP